MFMLMITAESWTNQIQSLITKTISKYKNSDAKQKTSVTQLSDVREGGTHAPMPVVRAAIDKNSADVISESVVTSSLE